MMKIGNLFQRVSGAASLLVAGLAMSACAADGSPTDEAANPAIAEVDLANGSRVMFFEPAPGALAIGQQTALAVAPVDTTGKSPVEVFRSIAPGQPVPPALAEAQARADEARSARPARAVPAFAASTESFTATGFENSFCYNEFYQFINCHTGVNDGGVTGNLDGTHTDIDEFKTTLCSNAGKVTLRAWVEGDPHLGVQVNEGNCWTYHWTSGLSNADSIRVTSTIDTTSANYFLVVKWNH